MPTRYASSLALLCALGLGACGSSTVTSDTSGGGGTPPGGSPPTVSLNAAPTSVASGGSTLLTWSSNASSCSATGAWTGTKAASGNQTISSITGTSTYTLTCTAGSGADTTRSTTVNVVAAGTGVNGAVDSSLVARHQEGANFVYAFNGSSTTTGTPAATAPVTQDVGGCTFHYDLPGLPAGNYTVALTSDSGATFKRSANVTVASSAVVQNFAPTRVLQVGPGKQFAHPNDVTGLASGDVIEIDPGVYNNTQRIWTTNNLTLRGVNGRAHMVAPATISNQKAIWVMQGANMMVENIEFSGASVPDNNGAGIRPENNLDMVICGSYIHDNQEGILADSGNLLIEYTEFARNGNCNDINGCAHNMYITSAARFTLRYSYSHHASIGHLVKSRAAENYILYNRIMDEASGTSSYTIDLPNGGLSYVIGNLLQQSPFTDNPTILIYGDDSLRANSALYVVNNTFVNDKGSGTFVEMVRGTATLKNNLFVGGGTVVSGGTVTQVTNQTTNTPNFVDRAGFDYRPTAATPGINMGTAPGLGGTFDLTPVFQYVHPINREPRPTVGTSIDIGAYEFSP